MKALEEGDGRARPRQRPGARELRPAARRAACAPRPARRSRSSRPTAPRPSARPCSRRSSTSTPPARTSSSTPSPATRPAPSSRACPTRSARPSCSRASASSTPAPTSTPSPTRSAPAAARSWTPRRSSTSATPATASSSPRPRARSRSSTRRSSRPAPGSGKLARRFGVKNVVQAGRGYSFSVAIDHVPDGPVYFPAQRVACTPIGDRLRVAGMMEFRKPEAALDERRVQAIADAARPLLRGADLDDRQDEWVGSRPCTVDGLPLIGATRSPAGVRRGRPRHVGHHPRPGHRPPARRRPWSPASRSRSSRRSTRCADPHRPPHSRATAVCATTTAAIPPVLRAQPAGCQSRRSRLTEIP